MTRAIPSPDRGDPDDLQTGRLQRLSDLDELGWTDLSDSLAEMKIRARDRQSNFPYLYDGDNQ